MKLLFKQRFFSWFDSYDIYDENGGVFATVEGKLSWGHCLKIYAPSGEEIGTVQEKVLTFLPQFEIWLGETYVGRITKEFSFFKPRFTIDYNGWTVDGDWLEWDYGIFDAYGVEVARISKEIWNWTDTYVLDIARPGDAMAVLMLVLAIDAEKCSRNN